MGRKPSLSIKCTFEVGYKHFETIALIDTGNNFGTCVSESFSNTLGYTPELLQPSPTDVVKQAGEGATLKVTGLLPSHVLSNSFSMENCPFKFTLHPIFVIKGLHQNVNISLPFLQEYKFIIDLETNSLQFNLKNKKFHIPFVLKNSSMISMIEVIAELPNSGIQVPPGQEVLIQTAHNLDDQVFTPRAPRIKESLKN